MTLSDQQARERALDPAHSFIVQAPAGSGKTELLTQRILRLLATVDHPEEVIAITFTRKAAAEMRDRVIDALRAAAADEPEAAHKRIAWRLARAVAQRDRESGWHLVHTPNRLRIQTIDSLCFTIARQTPLLSTLGGTPRLLDDPAELLQRAADQTIALFEEDGQYGEAVRRILAHLDNDHGRARQLLIDMLRRRDQWLRPLVRSGDLTRELLQENLRLIVDHELQAIAESCRLLPWSDWVPLLQYAADNAPEESPLCAWRNVGRSPRAEAGDLALWHGVAELCLTGTGSWRRQLNVKTGFPAKGSGPDAPRRQQAKDEMTRLLADAADLAGVATALNRARTLPSPVYTEADWQTLAALITLLKLSAANLAILFAQTGSADFNEIARAAILALGDEDQPTDLALHLDYRIRHLLVDEFQDTSINQYELLARLTAGWEPGDGRTLFCVGDPMQSIYRFREAEVGVFLTVRDQGIGALRPESLQLLTNFRSQSGIVDWVNATFSQIMQSDSPGTVGYTACHAHHPALGGAAVIMHPQLELDEPAEADQVVALVQEAKQADATQSIAILVRNRGHAGTIAAALVKAGLRYQAVDMDALADRPAIQDLFALTRALLHRGDRVAWLAVLRAPWCGLTLRDLTGLCADDADSTLWQLMTQSGRVNQLSDDGRQRLQRIHAVLKNALRRIGLVPFATLLKFCWLELGGGACAAGASDLNDAETYFRLLERAEQENRLGDVVYLAEQLDRLRASPDTEADGTLQLMTLHKSKGLQFDTVIIPGMGRQPRSSDKPLLIWQERTDIPTYPLLLGSIATVYEKDESAIYRFARSIAQQAEREELLRLLYVGTTRAVNRLHLLGHAGVKPGEAPSLRSPPAGSLLAPLWPIYEAQFLARLDNWRPPENESETASPPAGLTLRRLPLDWQEPGRASDIPSPERRETIREAIEFDWTGDVLRVVGVVVHALLHRIARDGLEAWPVDRVKRIAPYLDRLLQQSGVRDEDLAQARQRAVEALTTTLSSDTGRWALSTDHSACESELDISFRTADGWQRAIIDRTFIDEGTRWIIDFKTSMHGGGRLEQFIDSEIERYRQQLARYRNAMARIDERPIRTGLYFPLMDVWREVTG